MNSTGPLQFLLDTGGAGSSVDREVANRLGLKMERVNGIPFVDLQLSLPNGKSVRGSFLVDTGGNMVVHVYRQIAEDAGLLDGLATLPETGYGIGGSATKRAAARASALVVGPNRFERPIVVFTEDTAGLRANPNSIGLVGMEIFRRFNVTFDYSRSRMYLEPNKSLKEPFIYDASGLRLRASRPSFSPPIVSGVMDTSPALEAGIKQGDVLLEIDGRSTSGVNLETIRTLLKQLDKTFTLTLSRDQKTISAVLKTREMLK